MRASTILFPLVLALFTACGDDDDPSTNSTSPGQGGAGAGGAGAGGGGNGGVAGQGGAGAGGAGAGGAGNAGAAGSQGGAGNAGASGNASCTKNEECEVDAPCLIGSCDQGKCVLTPVAKGEACGGQYVCDGAGNCVGDKGYETRPANKTCLAFERPATDAPIKLEPFAPKLKFSNLLWMLQAPGDTDRFFVVQKSGGIQSFEGADPATSSLVADLKDRINAGPSEAGLLGMAFHPKFKENGQVFLSFTDDGPKGLRSVVARYTSTDGAKTIDLASEKIILTQDQPYGNHNGGMIAFGPDGFLYYGLGDGGAAGDPLNAGQTLTTLLGKMLRVDVDGGDPYAIPQDNPFAKGGGLPEIYAWGLRNPWRFSFDRATGDLWAGDVGQGKLEEIDLIKKGGNYGWKTMEGTDCYSPANGCDKTGLILPVVEYPHSQGVSVTGGYVYRGSAIPGLVGRYLYGDFGSGRIWGVQEDPVTGKPTGQELIQSGLNISSFAEDNVGEQYVLHYTGGTIRKIVPAAAPTPSNFPAQLSKTGCFDAADPGKPTEGLIPYQVNAPFWSDGAGKKRWFAIPDGSTIAFDGDGDLDLPVGSVVAKEFTLGGKRIETRLFVRHQDGDWAGYSYEWNDAQTDATYVPGGKTKQIEGQAWLYPSSAQCLRCHTEQAGRTLGLEFGQLNGLQTYPSGVTAHQITTLDKIGMLAAPLPAAVEALPRLPDPLGADPLESRAKSYLHTNCSFCHQPGGTGLGDADYRYATPFASMKICGVAPTQDDFGVPGAQVIAPGKPELSVLSLRVHALDLRRMPPLSSSVVDTQGASMLDAFITSLPGCPQLPGGQGCAAPATGAPRREAASFGGRGPDVAGRQRRVAGGGPCAAGVDLYDSLSWTVEPCSEPSPPPPPSPPAAGARPRRASLTFTSPPPRRPSAACAPSASPGRPSTPSSSACTTTTPTPRATSASGPRPPSRGGTSAAISRAATAGACTTATWSRASPSTRTGASRP